MSELAQTVEQMAALETVSASDAEPTQATAMGEGETDAPSPGTSARVPLPIPSIVDRTVEFRKSKEQIPML